MRPVRHLPSAVLCLFSVGVAACFGHHSADETVRDFEPIASEEGTIEEEDDGESSSQGAGASRASSLDAGAARPVDAGSAAQCAQQTDAIARVLCSAGLSGGGIDGLIGGLLGGGMQGMSCSKETDPIAALLCTATGTGGTGIEGIIGGLLGGGLLGGGDGGISLGTLLTDGGVERVLTNVLVEVVRGVLDDLVGSLLGPRDGGAGGLFGFGARDGGTTSRDAGPRRTSALVINTKSRPGQDLIRSAAECQKPSPEDLLTRLLCARQALDALDTGAASE